MPLKQRHKAFQTVEQIFELHKHTNTHVILSTAAPLSKHCQPLQKSDKVAQDQSEKIKYIWKLNDLAGKGNLLSFSASQDAQEVMLVSQSVSDL